MYLKSIEIQGFKSFANKLVFEFHNGITGIVGPNGSGKSNVADAVRWVLGEQRIKQLRGASMQDVIFAGTELRKPQGFAYVAITLDNSDHQLAIAYDQVTVSRRLYRSGESEYMINGSACRLKDINELFYDTGIGKEGYSIIGQGQIDKILSGRPEDRRELFDEAAGIVKFKRRKAIAQKKLEDEKASLLRVTDILGELEKQVGPLERQAAAAREYLKLRDELKICDANQFLLEREELDTRLRETQERMGVLNGDMEESRQKGEQLKEEYDRLEEELEALDQAMSGDREALNAGSMEKSAMEGRIAVLREQIHTEEMNEEHLENRRKAIAGDVEERKKSLDGCRDQEKELAGQTEKAEKRLEEAQERLKEAQEEEQSLEEAIETAKASIIQALNQRASLTASCQRYDTMLEQVNLRKSQVSQLLLKSKSEEFVQEEQIQRETAALEQIQAEIEDGRIKTQTGAQELEDAEQEVRRLNRRLNDNQQQYHMAYTRLESLKNLAERYDGYGSSIRRVMETRDRIHGIHGVVADIVTTKKEYETAIETALGGSIQNIVTDSETTAKELIAYLKKNRYGRATFLPLTSINGSQAFSRPEALKEKGVLGLASQLVQVEKQYEGLARYLLGRVVVADTIDNALALARKYRYSLRIVTLEGELLSPGGSMTGGAFKNSSNLLGRRREIEELEAACKKALVTADKTGQELALAEGMVQEKREELETLKARLQELAIRENTARMNISQLEDKKEEIRESAGDLVREHGQLEEQVREITESRRTVLTDSQELEARSQAATGAVEEKTALLEEARRKRAECQDEVASVQVECANLSQKLSFVNENKKRIEGEIKRLAEEAAAIAQGAGGSKEAIAQKEREIGTLQEKIKEAVSQAEELTRALDGKTRKKEELSGRQKGFFAAREELTARISALDKDLFRVQSQKEKLEERLEALTDYMWSEYEMTYSAAGEFRREEYQSLPQIKKQADELKARIKGLGNINVNAIEDYREISERYAFMKTQHEDLVKAQEELENIIGELDAGMRRQFSEKFAQIQREFDKVFKELFGGGRGSLELMEDEDLLEAGVQIIAQPPGKKLQNMMQLSGGEKALTAIALLFAIQNLKPSPFCLLDEIEAALDDSNVDRFAGYLHKLTKNTQFIVITHRRGTMVSADRLYGITMQEKGVSALVSVNLIEDSIK